MKDRDFRVVITTGSPGFLSNEKYCRNKVEVCFVKIYMGKILNGIILCLVA